MAAIHWTQDMSEPQARFSLMELLVHVGLGLLLWGSESKLLLPPSSSACSITRLRWSWALSMRP